MDETNATQPAPSGSNKKILYIIGAVVVVLLVGSFIMRGVGSIGMRAAGVNTQPGPGGSATYSNDDGSITVGANKMPDNWPGDAPGNYSGAAISFSGSSNPQTGEAGSMVMYSVKASADSVASYYKTQLAAKGWAIESTTNVGGATVITAKKDTRMFSLYVTGATDGSVTVQASVTM
jgi:hypothetical protein